MVSYALSLYFMAALFILAGISHFIAPRIFLKIMPPWVPQPVRVNALVGAAEVILGLLLLFPEIRSTAAWLIVFLLLAVFPANIYHFQQAKRKDKRAEIIITLLRLPLQGGLIY